MKFELGCAEMADWMEAWCFGCERDHHFSHVDEGDGCELMALAVAGEDVDAFVAHDEDWGTYVPALVTCSQFTPCTKCAPDGLASWRAQGRALCSGDVVTS